MKHVLHAINVVFVVVGAATVGAWAGEKLKVAFPPKRDCARYEFVKAYDIDFPDGQTGTSYTQGKCLRYK